jgi:recombination protein RecA
METAKQTQLQEFLKQCHKTYGKESVISANNARQFCDVTSTGSLKIDIALGIGGIPRGRLVEVFGGESSGKSTLCLQLAANVQKNGGSVLYVDDEHALDPTYAANLGVNLENLIISQPDSAEDALGIIKTGLVVGAFDLIVLDSIAGLTPQAVIDGEVGDSHVGRLARLMSQNCAYFASQASKSNTSLMLINQIREKVGVTYGSPETTPGGRAIRFYSSMRIQMSRSTLNKDGEDVLGNTVKVKVIKNKLAPPFKECEPEILYGEGFSRESEIVDLGSDAGIVEKAGSWYSYKGERVGQGKEAARQFFMANPELANEVELAVKKHFGVIPA